MNVRMRRQPKLNFGCGHIIRCVAAFYCDWWWGMRHRSRLHWPNLTLLFHNNHHHCHIFRVLRRNVDRTHRISLKRKICSEQRRATSDNNTYETRWAMVSIRLVFSVSVRHRRKTSGNKVSATFQFHCLHSACRAQSEHDFRSQWFPHESQLQIQSLMNLLIKFVHLLIWVHASAALYWTLIMMHTWSSAVARRQWPMHFMVMKFASSMG